MTTKMITALRQPANGKLKLLLNPVTTKSIEVLANLLPGKPRLQKSRWNLSDRSKELKETID